MKISPWMRVAAILAAVVISSFSSRAADTIPPSVPTNLVGTVATCGQVNLSWNASTDEVGGSGLKAYIITRNDPNGELFRQVTQVPIGADRISFSDTNYTRSSATLTYTVAAQDYAGNKSAQSNAATVTTPACPTALNELILDGAYLEPLGKSIATYGSRTAWIYAKQNSSLTLDTWLYLRDSDTGLTSQFLLHTSPGYRQIETDYVFTSANELWTLSYWTNGGNVLVSQYALNGSPIPTSATLVSTKPLGDSESYAKAMIRLKSGALLLAWNQDYISKPDGSVDTGFAYRSPTGKWTVKFPITIPTSNGGAIAVSRISMAQHPADGSIWAFDKRDSFHEMIALHFTETPDSFVLDWMNNNYISQLADGTNGPQGEFPFLSAVADPTRNVILLAYQTDQHRIIYIDQYNGAGGIFLKEAMATVAQIRADGAKTFIPFPNYMERDVQFGLSVQSDGTIWLAYPRMDEQTLTWNEVYASNYFAGAWSAPALVGFNYGYYAAWDGSGHGDPGFLAYGTDQPQVAFRTPDVKIHNFVLSSSSTTSDTAPPQTSITNPTDGATVSGVVSVTATATDNVGITKVNLLIDGAVAGTATAAPFTFSWDTTKTARGKHTLQTVAYDAADNSGASGLATVTIPDSTDSTAPVVAITNPLNGAVVPRNTTVTITATATDNVGVAKVEFYVAGKLVGTVTNSPYSYAWKVPARKNASYTLKAIAYDGTGNSSSATTIVTGQ
ncbi:MAG: hypothetical protein HYX72_04635 [Acidobacteria bacterium]|nr:hypothetical protein [Acidobacteriota bacterium]